MEGKSHESKYLTHLSHILNPFFLIAQYSVCLHYDSIRT